MLTDYFTTGQEHAVVTEARHKRIRLDGFSMATVSRRHFLRAGQVLTLRKVQYYFCDYSPL